MDANLAPDVRQSVDTLENYMQLLDEARGVLEDPSKRTTYDNYGHKGLENLASGKSAGTGQTWEQAAGPVQRKVYSEGDTMDFFDKIAERNRRDNGSSANDDGLTSEQRRERARQERRNRRNRDNNGGGF